MGVFRVSRLVTSSLINMSLDRVGIVGSLHFTLGEYIVNPRVLVVEDDPDISELVCKDMRELGFLAFSERDGWKGLAAAQEGNFNLVILDLMLPGIGGIEICRKLRDEVPELPILMLTAREDDASKILGFELGADDYLTKPYNSLELQARVKALLRRAAVTNSSKGEESTEFPGLVIKAESREVFVEGHAVKLTAVEYDLLLFLSSNPGKVYSRGELLSAIWGVDIQSYETNVNTHISRLRTKLAAYTSREYIHTLRGAGYRFARVEELS